MALACAWMQLLKLRKTATSQGCKYDVLRWDEAQHDVRESGLHGCPGLMHRQEAARSLVDVHDEVCADCVCAHQPAQLDEEPVRVGVLLLRAVELFQALGGLLAAQAHAMQELSDPGVAGTDVESLCVEPFVHEAPDPLRHSTSVTRMVCSLSRVVSAGESKVLLPSVSARGALHFQRYGVFGLIPSNILGHRRWTSHKHRCMSHRRSVLH